MLSVNNDTFHQGDQRGKMNGLLWSTATHTTVAPESDYQGYNL